MDTPIRISSQTDDMHEGIKRLIGFLSKKPHRDLGRGQLRLLLLNPLFRIVIARDVRKSYPENVVGMASISYTHTLTGTHAEINDVVVDPAHQGEGIGKRLVLELIIHARQYAENIGSNIVISLTSRPSRVVANHMYRKLGFTLTARHLRKNKEDFGTNLYRMTVTPFVSL